MIVLCFGMPKYIALLRAVNVGGTGKLPMAHLKDICCEAGFTNVETYIASGNVVFEGKASESKVKEELEASLRAYARKAVEVIVRTTSEMESVLKANPFSDLAPNYTVAIFLNEPPLASTLDHISGLKEEKIRLGVREIYVHYGTGMGRSKLKIPAAKSGTARNMNTIAKLVAIASKKEA